MKKKTVLTILFLIIGVIFMCIAFIPLAHLSGLDTTWYVTMLSKVSIFRFMFFYMFLSINFLNVGLSLFLNNKIEKILSIKRVIIITIIVIIFLRILIGKLFPITFSMLIP
jgi:hypothetical protein